MIPSYVVWQLEPALLRFGPFVLTWYELLFGAGLLGMVLLVNQAFTQQGKPLLDTVSLITYVGITTALGARLGYFLIRDPADFLLNPVACLLPSYHQLSGNGAAVGLFLGLLFYEEAHRNAQQSYLWLADRLIVAVPLLMFLSRLGYLMISEGVGRPTNVLWAFVFLDYPEFPALPRHPAQLYEALASLLLFGWLARIAFRPQNRPAPGRLLGLFLFWTFLLRFLVDDLKDSSVVVENQFGFTMNQWLSIPAILAGGGLIIRSYWKRKPGYSEREIVTP